MLNLAMRFLLIIGVLSLWILYAVVNTGWFQPYGPNQAPEIGNIMLFIIWVSLGVSALASIPGGYLYWAVERFYRKKKFVLLTKHFYQIWILLFAVLVLTLIIKVFNVI